MIEIRREVIWLVLTFLEGGFYLGRGAIVEQSGASFASLHVSASSPKLQGSTTLGPDSGEQEQQGSTN